MRKRLKVMPIVRPSILRRLYHLSLRKLRSATVRRFLNIYLKDKKSYLPVQRIPHGYQTKRIYVSGRSGRSGCGRERGGGCCGGKRQGRERYIAAIDIHDRRCDAHNGGGA